MPKSIPFPHTHMVTSHKPSSPSARDLSSFLTKATAKVFGGGGLRWTMSSRGEGGAAARTRVAIPSGAKKTIDSIKEITGQNHGEEEIYAMLKECSMDPNETAQKLLLLDTFQEVTKRRDRRREEPAPSRRMQDSHVQVNRAGRARPLSHDAGEGRNSFAVKENVINQIPEKAVGNATLGNAQKIKINEASSVSSPITDISSCPSGITSQTTNSNKDDNVWGSGGVKKFNKTKSTSVDKLEGSQPFLSPVDSNKTMGASGPRDTQQNEMVDSSNADNPSGVGKQQDLETMQTALPRPSSDLDIWPQVIVPQNVTPSADWKLKCTNWVASAAVGSQPESQQTTPEAIPELQRKLEELRISNNQQVVLPNHINVTGTGKLGFCFGSFDASFELEASEDGSLESDKSTPLTESSDSTDDPTKVLQQLSNSIVSEARQSTEIKEDLSSREVEVLSSVTYDHVESKQEVAPQGHQHSVIDTSPSYNYAYVQPMLNGQLRPSENSDSQARALPSFIIPQSFDPMGYYAQFYFSGLDSDGRSSPLNSAEAVDKYNGNVGFISVQTSQSPQEGNAPLGISSASPVPLIAQTASVVQTSISANQHHLPVFCPPNGIHLPHYPPFIPYAPYFSPIYVPPNGIHQLFRSGTFPQQPHSGNLYPNPHGTDAKYSNSQNEQGPNACLNHVGVPLSYGPYSSIPLANYTPSSVTEALNSTSNGEVKGNDIYASEQQAEGSAVLHGQVHFAPTQPALGTYTGVFNSAHQVTSASAHPLFLQQSHPIAIPIDMVGPTAGFYPLQQPQPHIQLKWPSNY